MRLFLIISIMFLFSCQSRSQQAKEFVSKSAEYDFEVEKSEKEWLELLGEDAYRVLREKGTEYAFTGEFNHFKKDGTFLCAGCGNELFASDTKYNSGCGWPSFYAPINEGKILEIEDNSHGMRRIEIMCAKCGGHLGHVFPDGPRPTGLRYCVNSLSLDFEEVKK